MSRMGFGTPRVLLPGVRTADHRRLRHIGIAQAFAQNALPDHAGCAEDNDFHPPSRLSGVRYADLNRLMPRTIKPMKNSNTTPWVIANGGSAPVGA